MVASDLRSRQTGADQKVLILYSSSGGGHLAAANNIAQALKLLAGSNNLSVTVKDSYDFVHPFKKWQYTKGWQIATTFVPGPYRYLRNRVVHSERAVKQLKKGFKDGADKLGAYLKDNPYDVIIATHAHAAGIAGILKDVPNNLNFYLAQVYTDYQFHAFYQNKNVDHYFAPAEWVAVQLKKSMPEARVSATGAPINVCFDQRFGPDEAKKKFGVARDNRLVVLVSRGSFGWGNRKNLEIVKSLASLDLPLHIIAHAGKNKKLAEKMFRIACRFKSGGSDIRVLGWVNNMFELMRMTDIYVGKPGGMQVAESLASQTPLLVFDPMPGQEDANVDFIVAQKVGALVKEPIEVVSWVKRFADSPELLWAYKKRASELGAPKAALLIAAQVLHDLNWSLTDKEPDLTTCLPGPPST